MSRPEPTGPQNPQIEGPGGGGAGTAPGQKVGGGQGLQGLRALGQERSRSLLFAIQWMLPIASITSTANDRGWPTAAIDGPASLRVDCFHHHHPSLRRRTAPPPRQQPEPVRATRKRRMPCEPRPTRIDLLTPRDLNDVENPGPRVSGNLIEAGLRNWAGVPDRDSRKVQPETPGSRATESQLPQL